MNAYNWIGGSGDLGAAGNWSPTGGPPGVMDSATINGNSISLSGTLVIITSASLSGTITLNQSNLRSSSFLVVHGSLILKGISSLQSDGLFDVSGAFVDVGFGSHLTATNTGNNLAVDSGMTVEDGADVHAAGTITVANASVNSTLNVKGTSYVYSNNIVVANQAASIGLIALDSAYLRTDFLSVGQYGTGALTLTNGANIKGNNNSDSNVTVGFYGAGNLQLDPGTEVDTTLLTMGYQPVGSGKVVVDNAKLTASNYLIDGISGNGSLTITNHSTVVAANIGIALNGSSVSDLMVTDSTLSIFPPSSSGATGAFIIGNAGQATAAFGNSQITASNLIMASQAGSIANVNVSSSTISASGSLVVGDGGTAIINVQNSSLAGQLSVIGNQPGSNSLVVLNNSTWNANSLVVGGGFGNGGTGKLDLQNGSKVTISGSSGSFIVGSNPNSDGAVNVSGPSALLDVSGSADDRLIVGNSGTGALTIANHAILKTQIGLIGNQAGSNGVISIDNSGWVAFNTVVGGFGTGTLNILNAAAFATQNLDVGNNGIGQINISGQSGVTVFDLNIGTGLGSRGAVNLTGLGTALNTINGSQQVIVGNFGTATLTIDQHATMTANTMLVARDAGAGNVNVSNFGVLNVQSLSMGHGATIDVSANGSIAIGTSTTIAGAVYVAGSGTLSGAGTIKGSLVNDSLVTANSGRLIIAGAVTGAPAGSFVVNANSTLEFAGSDTVSVNFNAINGTLQLDQPFLFSGLIKNFHAGDIIDLANLAYDSGTRIDFNGSALVVTPTAGAEFLINFDPSSVPLGNFALQRDALDGSTDIVLQNSPIGNNLSPAQISPITVNDFSFAQGWGSASNPRFFADIDHNGTSDYVAFGFDFTLAAFGGSFSDGLGHKGTGFSQTAALIHNFGTNEGYTVEAQRGSAFTGYGVSNAIYGQGFAGIYWYGATTASTHFDAFGHAYAVPNYETSAHFYGQFGTLQGWSIHNGFDIVKAAATDGFASILGFGNDGVIVGPQAFAPNAQGALSYLIPIAIGNNASWDQTVDVRTFQDSKGNAIDLNHDGITDFVGMGPQGLIFAFGTEDSQHYGLSSLQTASIGPAGSDLGRAQGWTDTNSERVIVHDTVSGFDDIIAFGAPGVFVAMGQDPSTHGGQPFENLSLAFADMGSNQGWSNALTPRLIGDVNGDGVPDLIGFGADNTFVALGARDASGSLHFSMDLAKTIHDFGYNEGWSTATTVRQLTDVTGTGHDSLVLSGAFGTHVWDLMS